MGDSQADRYPVAYELHLLTATGLFEIRLPDGVIVRGPDGAGMTKAEAEMALDNLEAMRAIKTSGENLGW